MSTNSDFLLLLLIAILFHGLIIGQAYNKKISTCHHLIPSADKLIFANNIHSADPPPSNLTNTDNDEYVHKLRRISRSKDTNLIANKKLVILPYFHSSFYSLPDEIVTLYKDNLIPAAIHYWENSLSLKYPHSPLYLGRFCNPSQSYYSESRKTHICESDCGETTKCGDYIPIPEEHLEVCQECKRDELSCKEKGKRHKGVNADFILYISSVHSEHCESSNTVAYSAYCQLESKYNRPVAGYTNICPNLVSTKKSAIQEALATLKHEILHPLGFSLGLFAFFIDKNGKPLTPRDPKTGKPTFNKLTNMHEPSEKVLKTILRKDWKIGSGFVNRNVTLLVTPRVVAEVRSHFNCSSLEGAELENQGEIGTRLTHWEKRIFEQEAMTGASTHNSVFSRITFALLEDTGWYNVNYSNAEEIKFGRALGCDFAQKSCKDWIDTRSARNQSIRPYCNQISDSHHRYETPKYECDDRQEAVMLCNLVKHKHVLPSEYQNFNATDHVEFTRRHAEKNGETAAHTAVNHLGGSVELADYCPLMQQVSWTVADGTRDSKCTIDENQPTEHAKNYNLEVYGVQSKCFLHEREWIIYTDRCQTKLSLTKTVGCYEYSCDPEQGLMVKVHDQYVKCSTKDEVVDFKVASAKYLKTTSIYYGNIICPSCEDICQNKIDCKKFQQQQQKSTTTTTTTKTAKNWLWLQSKANVYDEKKMCFEYLKHHPVESKSSEFRAEFTKLFTLSFITLFFSLL